MQPESTGAAHDGSGAVEPDIERMADDIAERVALMARELEAQDKIITNLLRHVGKKAVCTGPRCGQEIFWVLHQDTGKRSPYNADGTPHFGTCPDRDQFHARRTNAANNSTAARSDSR